MADNSFRSRLATVARDPVPWVVSGFGGATAWVLGGSVTVAALVGVTMLGTAAVVGALTVCAPKGQDGLRAGTRQHALIDVLDAHVRSMRVLTDGASLEPVRHMADDALSAALAARSSLLRVAAAVDGLDEAIGVARTVPGQGEHAAESIAGTVGRLVSRRATLLDKLATAVDEVATVYAGLVEISATARTVGMAVDDTDVVAVKDSVTLMRLTFAELDVGYE